MPKVQVSKKFTFSGHKGCVYTLERSSEAPLFFSGGEDGMVVRWNIEDPDQGKLLARVPHSIYALHFHSPSGLLVAGHNYEGIHLLDPLKSQEVGSLKFTTSAIYDIKSWNDILFAATGNGKLYIVDLPRLQVMETLDLGEERLRSIAINPDTGEMAVAGSDRKIRIFDPNLRLLKEFEAHDNSIFSVRYSPDRETLFSVGRDARIRIWDAKADYRPVEEIVGHMYTINHLDFSPDGKHFVTCSMDKSIKVWDTDRLKLLKVIDKARHAGHGTSVNKLLWSSHQGLLVSASDDTSISIWDLTFEE